VVCDNLKAGVTGVCRYEPGIHRTYQELAEHYDTAVLPAGASHETARQGQGRSGHANCPTVRAGRAAQPPLLPAP
jgi:hypothetical protein